MDYISKNRSSTKDSKQPHNVFWKKRVLATAVAGLLCQISAPVFAGYAEYNSDGTPLSKHPIGDLEIYQAAKKPGANVVMMLDLSGSMGTQLIDKNDRKVFYRKVVSNTNPRLMRFVSLKYVEFDSRADDNNAVSCVHNGRSANPHGQGTTDNGPGTGPGTGNIDVQYGAKWLVENVHGHSTGLKGTVIVGTEEGAVKTMNYTVSGCKPGSWAATTTRDTRYNYAGETSYTYSDSGAFKWVSGVNPLTSWDAEKDLDRIGALKHALITALGEYTQADVDNPKILDAENNRITADKIGTYRIPSNNLLGIGLYSGGGTRGDRGSIVVPGKLLTLAHRTKLIEAIDKLTAGGNTPIARAYGEAGAYMLGATTSPGAYPFESGFKFSASDTKSTKDASKYQAPGADSSFQCYGKGIYFLTDGVPNYAKKNTSTMVDSIITSKKLADYATSPNLQKTDDASWPIIGQFAKSLRDYDAPNQDIRTATVGFGSTFDIFNKEDRIVVTPAEGDVPEKTVTLKPMRTITDKRGKKQPIPNCGYANADNEVDVRNLCKWGMLENHTRSGKTYVLSAGAKRVGGGGFTPAQNAQDITNSLVAFLKNGKNDIKSKTSGTILVPEDPFRGNSITPYAYVPVLKPNVGGGVENWLGNLKKYETKDSTLYGKSDKRLYTSMTATSHGGKMQDSTADLWDNTRKTAGHNETSSGGFYARLKGPTKTKQVVGNTRNVFVESYTKTGNTSGLTKIVPAGTSTVTARALNSVQDTIYGGVDSEGAATAELIVAQRKVLNFMGFNISLKGSYTGGSIQLQKPEHLPTTETRSLGSIIHSKPALAAYSAEVDANGRIKTTAGTRDEYLLFGSTDGTLHMVNAETGEEKWALILQEMFKKQPNALVVGNQGLLKFGVDAPWLVSAKYNYEATVSPTASSRVTLLTTATSSNHVSMAAYGGFRLGGRGMYALDLTDKEQPKMLFKITPNSTVANNTSQAQKLHTNVGGTLTVNKGTDYNKLGYIWSKPTMARVFNKTLSATPTATATKTPTKDVIIFGGGYDLRYEKANFVPKAIGTNITVGSSVYIADAKTGAKLWSWQNPYNHSIVGEITALDGDADGYFEHLYFADLGGNLFRADFINNGNNGFGATPRNAAATSVTRILNTDAGKDAPAYRFYSRPVVSFYTDESDKIFALINVTSGDRSSPLSNKRNTLTGSNRVYGIIDREMTSSAIIKADGNGKYQTPMVSDLTESNLVSLGGPQLAAVPTASANVSRIDELCNPKTNANGTKYVLTTAKQKIYSAECKKKVALVSEMLDFKNGSTTRTQKDGWYYSLTDFNGYAQVKNVKSVGENAVIGSTLYVSAYDSSTVKTSAADACDAEVKGATEIQVYCLPYGVCMDDSAKTGMGGFTPAGEGIQELSFGSYSKDHTDVKVLITTASLQEKVDQNVSYGSTTNNGTNPKNPTPKKIDGTPVDNYGESTLVNSEGSANTDVFLEKYELQPKQWYEVVE